MKRRKLTSSIIMLCAIFSFTGCSKTNAGEITKRVDTATATSTNTETNEATTKTVNAVAVTATTDEETVHEMDYLVLVNKEHKLPDDWEDTIHISSATSASGKKIYVESEALENYYELAEVLREEEDITILLDSTYRTVAYQEDLVKRFTQEYGEDYVKQYVAVPGYSEHHTGLAIDVCLRTGNTIIDDNDAMIEQKEIFNKIHELMPKYGFILRYPEGKDDITGYAYEPWHLRYVGSSEIAKEITDRGLTLEEYLASK